MPEEALDHAAAQLRQALEADLLDRVRAAPSTFLERVVVDLLIAMGYGGGNAARGRVTGQAGDGGIDGTIREDALGLDEVYLQAKKYAPGTTVGEGALRNFAGAIDAANTTKGVFVTTAGFTRSATDYVAKSPKRIVLIDGEELARLMVVHEIGYARVLKAAGSQSLDLQRDAWVALPMGGVAPVGQTAAIDPFLTASPSTGLLTGQGEHGLSHPTLEAVVVHELLEQFGIILDERRHDTRERLAVLNASIVLIGVLASVLERSVLGDSKRNGLRDHLLHPVGVLPRDGTEQVIELSQDARGVLTS